MSLESAFKKIEGEKTEVISDGFDEKKQERMKILNEKLKQLDEKGRVLWEDSENRITLNYDEKGENGRNFICVFNGDEYKLTMGDIIADYGWRLKYLPSQEMPENIYRQLSKRILTNEARRDIEDINDKEIIEDRSQLTSGERGGAIDNKKTQLKIDTGKNISDMEVGKVSEKMVQEFMTRMSYNVADFPNIGTEIKIIRSSIKEDVKEKIDFKILSFSHTRGVKTVDEKFVDKTANQFKKMGFQLATFGNAPRKHLNKLLTHKTEQLKNVRKNYVYLDIDDIVLVGVRTKHTRELYKSWVDSGKPPGGPERLWNIDRKKIIFRAITDKLKINLVDGKLEKILK